MKIFKQPLNIYLFLVLLILVVLGNYSLSAINKFYTYKNTVDKRLELTLGRFHFFLKNEIKREWIKLTASKPLNTEDTPLKTFYITLKQEDVDTLNENLPMSGKDHYINAYMNTSDGKKIQKIKLRYRGDTNLHWMNKQKSLRIKLSKKHTYNMEKKFNLINPPHDFSIIDCVAYDISKELNLISPDYTPIRLFINGKYMGVYIYLSQVDESLLRKYKRMPGSIYAGDNGSKKTNGVSDLWNNKNNWKKVASRNAEQKSNKDDITFYIKALNNFDDIQFYNFVENYLDKKKFYTFFALDTLFGSFHHDFTHNHKLYFDPYIGRFEPIQWDLRYWSNSNYKDTSNYLLLERIKLNPLLEAQRDLVAYNISKKYNSQDIIKRLRKYKNLIKKDLDADVFKDTGTRPKLIPNGIAIPHTMKDFYNSMTRLESTIKKRETVLKHLYGAVKSSYMIKPINHGLYKLTFKVSGNNPIEVDLKQFAQTDKKLEIYKDINFNEQLDKNDTIVVNSKTILYPGRKFKDGNAIDSNSKFAFGNRYLTPTSLYYNFFIKNPYIDGKIIAKNYITKKSIYVTKQDFIVKKDADSIHPWQIPNPKNKTKVLKGTIHVTKTLTFDKQTNIKIEPNTTFIMSPKTSIYFYSKVTAIGTKSKPIKFIAKDAQKPWGLVALQGKATSNSKFHYIIVKDGSVDTKNLIHYTAPFNIHNTKNFEVKHAYIGKNYIGDDAMHIAYSNGIVEDSIFDEARSDALDIDISDVTVINNIFKNSGNDGLDIMTTTMTASNNSFINTGDKGISVGEWSDANITDSSFTNTFIGLEIKDKSKVIANNLIFKNSQKFDIHLYNKNRRYNTGGTLTLYNPPPSLKIKADKRSHYELKRNIP